MPKVIITDEISLVDATDVTKRKGLKKLRSSGNLSANTNEASADSVVKAAIDAVTAGTAPLAHTHPISDVTNLQTTLNGKAASSHTHPTSEVTGLDTALAGKQPTLNSGTNIKTINGVSVLGSGDIPISGGSSASGVASTLSTAKPTAAAGKINYLTDTEVLELGKANATWEQVATRQWASANFTSGGGTGLGGYVIPSGLVSDGSFSSGTNNSAQIQAAVNAASDNQIIYIPAGDYRCLTAITWRTGIRLHMICLANLYFSTSDGFVFPPSSKSHIIKMYGKLSGTDQSGTPNYTSLANAGLWIQNTNSLYEVNMVHGFEDAIRIGGYAGGTAAPTGAQYNTVRFLWLWRNKRGIHISPRGGTTTDIGNWCNENLFYGGQISCDIGVKFTKDTTQSGGNLFNGNKFYGIGFEYAGGGIPMQIGIQAEFCSANEFYGGRFEPNGVTTPISFAADVDNMQFHGWFFYLDWLPSDKIGNSLFISGQLYERIAGRQAGYMAQGNNFDSGSYLNNRLTVYGTKRSPSVCLNLPTNIDVIYDYSTSENAIYTANTFAVNKGVNNVTSNSSAVNSITCDPAVNPDRVLSITNLNATGTITFNGFTIPVSSCWTFRVISGVWRIQSKG